MSKHWCPDEICPVKVAPAPADVARAVRETPKRIPRNRLSSGEKAGLLLVAAVCAGVVLGLHQTFGRVDVFAEELVAPASPRAR